MTGLQKLLDSFADPTPKPATITPPADSKAGGPQAAKSKRRKIKRLAKEQHGLFGALATTIERVEKSGDTRSLLDRLKRLITAAANGKLAPPQPKSKNAVGPAADHNPSVTGVIGKGRGVVKEPANKGKGKSIE